ncbi:hypothetical protein GCM10020220_069240 [Nonomuraea rubra]
MEVDPPVLGEQFADGRVPAADGGVAQPGHEQHVRGHPRAEQPGGDLVGQRRGLVHAVDPSAHPVHGVGAAREDPGAFGEVAGDDLLKLGQPSGRVGQHAGQVEAAREVVVAQHLVRGAERARGGDLQQHPLVRKFPDVTEVRARLGDHHDVHVRRR